MTAANQGERETSALPTDAELAALYRDRAEGLSADLDGAVEKLWEVGGEEGREWVGWNYAKTAERLRREDEVALASAPPPAVPDAVGVRAKGGVYVASKTRHAAAWKAYRERGWPINSTWIDEAGVGESGDLSDLWRRCIGEASSAAVLVVYREPDDVLKGGWVEVGSALASGVPVYAVGLEGFTIAHDKRIRHFETLDDAMDAAAHRAAFSTPEPQTGERDKAIHDLAEAIALGRGMCDADDGGSTDLDVFRKAFFALDAVEQMLLAERTAREAGERRLAEVDERAREDERDARRYRHLRDNHVRRWTSNMGGPDSLDIGFDANGHDLDAALDAALRAEPEAQSVAGKEGADGLR